MNCPECSEQYSKEKHVPIILVKCGHTFCELCLKKIYDESQITCPKCKTITTVEYISCLPKNMALLDDLILLTKQTSSVIETTQVSIPSQATIITSAYSHLLCDHHYKNIELFCENDKSLLCVNCIVDQNHKNHNITAISKAAGDEREFFSEAMKEIEIIEKDIIPLEDEYNSSLKDIESTSELNLKEIENFFGEIRRIVNERELIQIRKVIAAKNTESRKFNEGLEKLKRQMNLIKELKLVNSNLDSTTDIEFLKNVKAYSQQIKDIAALPLKPKNTMMINEIDKDSEVFQLKKELYELTGSDPDRLDRFERLDNNKEIEPKNESTSRNPIEKKDPIIYPSFSSTYNIKKTNDRKGSNNNIAAAAQSKKSGLTSLNKADKNKIMKKSSNTDTNLIQLEKKASSNLTEKERNEQKVKSSINKANIPENKDSSQGKKAKQSGPQNTFKFEKFDDASVEGEEDTFTFVNKKVENTSTKAAITREQLGLFPMFKHKKSLNSDDNDEKFEEDVASYSDSMGRVSNSPRNGNASHKVTPILSKKETTDTYILPIDNSYNNISEIKALHVDESYVSELRIDINSDFHKKASVVAESTTTNEQSNSLLLLSQSKLMDNTMNATVSPDMNSLYKITNSYLLILGGKPEASTRRFDFENKKWTENKQLLINRSDFSTVMYKEKKILVMGGKIPSNGSDFVTDLIELLNTEENTVKKLDFKLKTTRCSFGTVYMNSKLYIAGGYNGKEVVNSFEFFDKKDKVWNDLPKMPYKKKEFCMVVGVNKNVYVLGGCDEKDKVSKSVEMFNIEKEVWVKIDDMNQPRKGFCAICMPDGIYVFGGSDGCQSLKSVEKYDFYSGKWKYLQDMNYPKCNFACMASRDCTSIYAIGGYDSKPLNIIEKFDLLPPNRWTILAKIPYPKYRHQAVLYGD